MKKSLKSKIAPTKFKKEPTVDIGGFTITSGDMIKIRGEYGMQFKFSCLVTNSETGAQWIDCFETFRGTVGSYRSFTADRIKRIPKRRIKKVKK